MEIERIVKSHKRVFLLNMDCNRLLFFLKELDSFIHNNPKRYGTETVCCCIKQEFSGFVNADYSFILELFNNEWIDLWRTYEFSDRFTVISEDSHLGSMLNYVETGLISWDEYFDALLAE